MVRSAAKAVRLEPWAVYRTIVFPVVPGERLRGPGPIRRSISTGHGVWVPAGACTRAGEAGPGCGDDSKSLLPRANSQIQLSNSLSQRSAARILCRGPGEARLPFIPRPMRGDGAPCGATSGPTPCGVDVPLRGTFATRRSTCGFSVRRDRASGRGRKAFRPTVIQAAFAALPPRRVQPFKAAPRSWSGRRPGASRRRGCETTPAGAASDPTLHDAS